MASRISLRFPGVSEPSSVVVSFVTVSSGLGDVAEGARDAELGGVIGIGLGAEIRTGNRGVRAGGRCGQRFDGDDRVGLAGDEMVGVALERGVSGDDQIAVGFGVGPEQLGGEDCKRCRRDGRCISNVGPLASLKMVLGSMVFSAVASTTG